MVNSIMFTVLLFLTGTAGGLLSFYGTRDGTTLIVIGYGFSLLQLGAWEEDSSRGMNKAALIIALLVVFILSLISVMFSLYKFNTNFNRVMAIGFVSLQVWNANNLLKNVKQKK